LETDFQTYLIFGFIRTTAHPAFGLLRKYFLLGACAQA
jgi:hypothetical protein